MRRQPTAALFILAIALLSVLSLVCLALIVAANMSWSGILYFGDRNRYSLEINRALTLATNEATLFQTHVQLLFLPPLVTVLVWSWFRKWNRQQRKGKT
jgi:hypothetical protein